MLHDNVIRFNIFCGLFYDAVSISYCIALNDKAIGQGIDKHLEEIGCSPIVLEGLKKS
jgi:hypothetical protein